MSSTTNASQDFQPIVVSIAKKCLGELEKFEYDLLNGKIHQYVIDLVQELPMELSEDIESGEIISDTIGALCYRIDTVLEITNPEFKEDIYCLTTYQSILDKYYDQLEKEWKKFRNQ